MSVFQHFFQVAQAPRSTQSDHPEPVAGHSVRQSILSPTQAGMLAAVVCALAIFAEVSTAVKTAEKGAACGWAVCAGSPLEVEALAFSPDARKLATGGEDGAVVIWEVGGRVLEKLPGERALAVLSVAFSPNGATLA